MSIVQTEVSKNKAEAQLMRANYDEKTKKIIDPVSQYEPTDEEKTMRDLILRHFTLANVTMFTPRVEFNDLSVIMRDQVDQMAWNTYQSNNGQPLEGDVNAWKSNAIRPVVRNKAISIAAHATARLVFPKIFAYNSQSDNQEDAAMVMSDLIEWAADQSNYEYQALQRVLASLYSPASIGYTEYAEVYRQVKKEKVNGKWVYEPMLDEDQSGFRDRTVPVDQLYIENFYESDVQKQGFLIFREVIGFELAREKYGMYGNFKHVTPGVQILYNDANQTWYQVYDTNMRQEEVEVITYWNRSLDVKITLANGVMMSDPDCPNPRMDKRYPFDKFGYQIINSRCFYYKSLAFYLQQDASIINTLYPMIVDGTYLSIMKPMVVTGGEIIGSDVYVPGASITLQDPASDIRPINTQIDLVSGMNTLQKVEESVSDSSNLTDTQEGQASNAGTTAYEISRLEQNANTVLGLFVKMISQHVRDFGKLRVMDILQYLTIPEVSAIEDDAALVYKAFLMPDKQSSGRTKSRKIKFDSSLPDENITEEEYLKMSYDALEESSDNQELWKVNPTLLRSLKYMVTCSPDVMNPKSQELEHAYNLELYDRAIANPILDQEQVTKDFLLSSYSKSQRNPDKYIAKGNPAASILGAQGLPVPGQNPQQGAKKPMPAQAPAAPVAPGL